MQKIVTARFSRHAKDKSVGQVMLTDNESMNIYGFFKLSCDKMVLTWCRYETWKGHKLDKKKMDTIISKSTKAGMFDDNSLRGVITYDSLRSVSTYIDME